MGSFSIFHWLVVLAIILLLFGTSKVSNLMGEFGKGIKSFKQNVSDDDGKTKDAAMTPKSSLGAPLPEPVKTSSTVNQG